ncbi:MULTISPECIES: lipoate--protein ligase [Amylolactobacillus]|uniref:lipoate--protein ligase n=3 Tax=Amylolactobacillus TaxID=2767876 RepID=A0A1L6XDZ2_9LACO|nr:MULTISPECIES: lipoate--protein ligase [Amylolactobacillus]APT19206.1 lipoate--protein ligase [Amylolactobacillus amylophilus DSM 20533 = JCM 1125]GED79701.1 lipoate--protein ligase [Amylolactobacillus amylophilus]
MYYVIMKSDDIGMNLATEQYLMNEKSFDEPLLLFYIEKPSIIVGRNQNTYEEVNADYVEQNNITVTRRLSGGGAVYHDLGNLCFSFVVNNSTDAFGNFKKYTQPVIDALHKLGAASAEGGGRNDLLVDGKKFSGNAMYSKNGKTFSHGTLSWDVDLDVLTKALNVPADKIASKGIKSIRQRVTNIKPYVDPQYQNLTTEEFRDVLLLTMFDAADVAEIRSHEYVVTPEDQVEIDKIVKEYYHNWDWVYGKNPEFSIQKRQHFSMGTIDARINSNAGKITEIKFYGDFFGTEPVQSLADILTGVNFDRAGITAALADVNLGQYFNGIDKEEFIDLLVK